jgi:pimeloyl-ACP methyl ester carboxylesterase
MPDELRRQDDELADPIRDAQLVLPDGRRLGYAEWGRPDGTPVLLLHRSPGSRLFDPDPSVTSAAGVRLVTVDRPGYGQTDPVGEPSRSAVAEDVVALADALELDDLPVLGWSGGGQFAFAPVIALGDRVRSFSLLATPAPDHVLPWWPDELRPELPALLADPVAATIGLTEANAWYGDNPDALLESDPGPSDARVRDRPGVRAALSRMWREGARQGGAGIAFDIIAGAIDDTVPVDRVSVPTRLWYGADDFIGPAHGEWYAAGLASATLTVLPDAGHLLPIEHWAAILDAALAP